MSTKKKITIFVIVLAVIIISIVGITFAIKSKNKKPNEVAATTEIQPQKMPEVDNQNTEFEISETELTDEKIIVKVTSKLEDYNLYYCIKPIVIEENEPETDEIIEEETTSEEDEYILYENDLEIEENSEIFFKYELDGKFSENDYKIEINNIINNVPENEAATKEELEKEKVDKKEISDSTAPYYIIVNYNSNVVTIYGKDENNEYTVPVKAMVCSTGTATPRGGVYKLTTTRYRWRALFGNVYGQYAVKIVGNILFHSVPYLKTDNSTLEYWEYDKLGTSASAGCVRLTVADALWIYNNCGSGTFVEFSGSAANPLGKPSAQKISGYEEVRGYDPTDPAANNPWKTFNIPKPTTPVENTPVQDTTPNNTPSQGGNDTNNNTTSNDKDKEPTIPEIPEEKPTVPDNSDSNNGNTDPDNKDEGNNTDDNTGENTGTDNNNNNENNTEN